jgi:hypothetical protein
MKHRNGLRTIRRRLLSVQRQAHVRDERGDVPGWVMITVMTIVVATAIIGIFQPWVTSFLSDTLDSVG